MNGFSFELNGIKFKASSLGNDYKWQQLKGRLNYDEISDGKFLTQHREALTTNGGSGEDIRKSGSVEPSSTNGATDGIRKSGGLESSGLGGAPGRNGEANYTVDRAIFSDTKPAGSGAGTGEKIGSNQPSFEAVEQLNSTNDMDFDSVDHLDFISTAFSDIPKSASSAEVRNNSKTVYVQTDLTSVAVANQLRAMSGVQNFEIGVRDNMSGKMFIQNIALSNVV